jgi:hypothetical protein
MTKENFRDNPVPRSAACIAGHSMFNAYTKHIGVKFNGKVMLGSVYVYNADEGWIETAARDSRGKPKLERGRVVVVRIEGTVEPYWR